MNTEKWKEINEYKGLYCVSNLGRVKTIPRKFIDYRGRLLCFKERILKRSISKDGYLMVRLTKDGISKYVSVHSLVAKAFIDNPNNYPCINHKDENKGNPIVSNLEWCTYSYNNTYGTVLERRKKNTVLEPNDKRLKDILICILKNKSATAKKNYVGVAKIDKDWNIIEIYNSHKEAADKNNFERHLLIRTKSKNGVKNIKNMFFVTEDKKRNYTYPDDMDVYKNKNKNYKKVKVKQYSTNGTFLKEYESVKDAGRALGNETYSCDISACCRGRLKTSHGFLWRYSNDSAPQPYKKPLTKAICQFSLEGDLIEEFPSITAAARKYDFMSVSSISNNLRGISNSAYGYLWKYKN